MLFVIISFCLISIACMVKNKKLKYSLFISSILISILSMYLFISYCNIDVQMSMQY